MSVICFNKKCENHVPLNSLNEDADSKEQEIAIFKNDKLLLVKRHRLQDKTGKETFFCDTCYSAILTYTVNF